MYKRILVAVDGSENSKRATEHAAQIAAFTTESQVEILHVVDYDRARNDAIKDTKKDKLPLENKDRLTSIKGVFEKKRIEYKLFIKQGEPGSTIVSFANRGGFDLVIIGSRGLNSFQKILIGGVSQKVAKHVKAPVMIVK